MEVRLEGITKSFGDFTAVNNLNVTIDDGTLAGLLGPSGCGKSTTLYMIAGLEKPTSGRIYFGDEDVTDLPPEKRGIGLVFQNYALYPHMTVRQNIMFPLENAKVPKAEALKTAQEMADLVQIGHLMDRKPGELSGGQQQRVAIARAIAKKPRVLLLDEPLSNLDARLRLETREEIRRIQQETGITTIFVTHDQEEAMSITDTIVLMKDGVLQQKEAPQEMYRKPANQFVASFMGTPPMGFLTGKVENHKIMIGSSVLSEMEAADGEVIIGVRPESWRLSEHEGMDATVTMVEVIGRDTLMTVEVEGQKIRCLIDSDYEVKVSDKVKLAVKPQAIHLFDKTSGHRLG
ncbi:MAG: ABC transporter ATP-binding protein [Turicibacter sp.]|jgi:multiple sugar transport system ATP-binding protein|uniref:Sugar ABC transporter ATP-binding protein n=1 Tax=Turicibacter faecis TaxID=2963365 RepID=A0ABM8ILD2_9FIRM|nr:MULTISPECIES: ABC transporter ATP-binding protein [unclassified Turicibacter]MCI8700687.1 ABC transporter ATP-binding protein [Turicibacter sp.]BEH90165.1 sugar ABC transporter ATP-binding protein [Turicibacter sp. TC023]MCU7204683.1 ABC transporter ATP-binding protein [Turicibacter sp. TA25]MCU7208538.1 ABC transporter ATP-binding protein [Turicibacter sp. 1E2]NCE78350.1 ABC transporter ATP-binding protein [Turicibacter sp. TS3]